MGGKQCVDAPEILPKLSFIFFVFSLRKVEKDNFDRGAELGVIKKCNLKNIHLFHTKL